MGAILEQYLSTFGQTLQQLAAPAPQARTFPTEGPGAMPAPPLAFQQQPGGEMSAAGMPVGQTFETGGQVETAPAPSFEAQPGAVQPVAGGGGPAAAGELLPFDQEQPVDLPTFEEPPPQEVAQAEEPAPPALPPGTEGITPGQAVEQGEFGVAEDQKPKTKLKPSEINTVDELFDNATEEEMEKGVDVIEEQLKEQGSSLDEAYGNVTGGPPDTRLTRQEKGRLLMEFGLRMLAYSGQEGGEFEAIGRAGIETLGSSRAMKAGKAEAARVSEQDKLAARVKEAQIARDKASNTSIETNSKGEMISVNLQSGEVKKITDAEGNPVSAGSDLKKFESEMNREAYRQYFIDTTGECDAACERGALAYSKGGAAEVAFPELMYADQTDRVMKILEDSDNASAKYPIPGTDQTKRWKDMNAQEKEAVASGMVDRRMRVMEAGGVATSKKTKKPAPDGWKNFESVGMDEDLARTITPGKQMAHPEGGWIENADGVLKRVDDNGKPWSDATRPGA